MENAERIVLERLRKGALSHLSNSEYEIIEKAVDEQGIKNLTGSPRALVMIAVAKHGTHDQSSHGNWSHSGTGVGTTNPQGYSREHFLAFSQIMFGANSPKFQSAVDKWGDSAPGKGSEAHRGSDDKSSNTFDRNMGTIHRMSPEQAMNVQRIARNYTTGPQTEAGARLTPHIQNLIIKSLGV